jgi:hypothetical protein
MLVSVRDRRRIKIRRNLIRSRKRQDCGWKRRSRSWLYTVLGPDDGWAGLFGRLLPTGDKGADEGDDGSPADDRCGPGMPEEAKPRSGSESGQSDDQGDHLPDCRLDRVSALRAGRDRAAVLGLGLGQAQQPFGKTRRNLVVLAQRCRRGSGPEKNSERCIVGSAIR